MKKKIINFIIPLFFIIVLVGAIILTNIPKKITNFEECVAAGNPVMESYPRQCKANDQTFVEDISIEISGEVSLKGELFCPCFLVGEVEVWYDLIEGKSPVDVSEINNGDFVFVKGEYFGDQVYVTEISKATECKFEDRNADACIEIYSPVCGMPINQTFSNSCFACINESVEYYSEGECL